MLAQETHLMARSKYFVEEITPLVRKHSLPSPSSHLNESDPGEIQYVPRRVIPLLDTKRAIKQASPLLGEKNIYLNFVNHM